MHVSDRLCKSVKLKNVCLHYTLVITLFKSDTFIFDFFFVVGKFGSLRQVGIELRTSSA